MWGTKAAILILSLILSSEVSAQRTPPSWQTPEPGGKIQYRDSAGVFLGESINRNGVITHRNSSGGVVYIDRCSGRVCTRTEPSGRIVQTWSKDR